MMAILLRISSTIVQTYLYFGTQQVCSKIPLRSQAKTGLMGVKQLCFTDYELITTLTSTQGLSVA